MVDCLRKSVAAEGWPVLWRGFFPTWARLGPWQLTFWLVYERMRAAAGMDGF
jgi:solute carrier family 25 uncoupling protein 27